jgi:TPR repeat protein
MGLLVHCSPNPSSVNSTQAQWYRMAAEQGSAQGQFFLGYCYSGGKGVAQDFAEAIKWYRKSSDQNYPAAQMRLGDCYFLGQGVTKDKVEAVKWYHKAAERGDFFSSQMTPEQIAEAQKLSAAFVPQKEKSAQ